MKMLIFVAVALLAVLPVTGLAQDTPKPAGDKNPEGIPTTKRPNGDDVHPLGNPYLRIEIEEPAERIRIDDDVHLLVSFTNLSDEPLNIKKLWLHPPHELIATRTEGTVNEPSNDPSAPLTPPAVEVRYTHPDWFTTQRNSQIISIPAKSSGTIRMIVPAPKSQGWEIFKSIRVLCFHPSEYIIRVQADHELPGNHDTSSASARVRIRLIPSPWSYVYGGILGSLIAIFFRICYDATRSCCSTATNAEKPKARKSTTPTAPMNPATPIGRWRFFGNFVLIPINWCWCFFANFLTGSFVALLLLLINYRLKDTSMSVNIAVTDFLGAVVLGIFSHKLAKKAYEFVFKARVEMNSPSVQER